MGFRSRALLTGVATGFLKANNDRRDRMAERMQQLSDNRATMDRERAKSRADAASKAAAEESSKWHSLRSNGDIDDEGNYTDKYNDAQAMLMYTKDGVKKAIGNEWDSFRTEFRKMGPTKFVRQYKDADQIEASLQNIYSTIDTRQRGELQRPALTGFDSMLGSMVNRVSSAVGGGNLFEPPSDGTLDSTPTPELDVMREQGPVENRPYESPSFTAPKPESQKAHKFITGPDGKVSVAFADSETGVDTFDTGLREAVDPNMSSAPKLKDVQDKRYLNGNPIAEVVEATFVGPDGVKYTKEGVMQEGKFVHIPGLSQFSDADAPEAKGVYSGDNNVKQAQSAQDVLYSSVRATKTLGNIKSLYNPRDYGSEAIISDVGNSMTAMFRMFNVGFDGGNAEKDTVLKAMEKGSAFSQLDPAVQQAITSRDYKALKVLTKAYTDAELQDTIEGFSVMATNDKEKEILSELRSASISAELQPLVRDLLRAWTGGDKKPAWGAAEHLLESIKAGSTPEKLMAQVDVYERDMARTSMKQLEVKFDHSIYSMSNDLASGFQPQDITDKSGDNVIYPETEVKRDRRTGEYLMVKTGYNSKGEVIRYFIPSSSQTVYQVRVPTKGAVLTAEDKKNFQFTTRLLDKFNQTLNVHGRPIN